MASGGWPPYGRSMRSQARRLLPLALLVGLMASLTPASVVAAPSESQLLEAEAVTLDKINDERADRGLVALRNWGPLADLARERAVYMAEHDLLSHTHAGGLAVWDMMSDDGITWFRAGEIIAYNTTSGLNGSAATAVSSWMGSPPHKAIAMSDDYNYVGFGVAISSSTGRRYWAGVFLKGPDHTGAWSKILSVSKDPISSSKSRVTIRWDGGDTTLQVLTAGFKHYDIQRRVNGGGWYDYGTRTSTSTTRTWTRGKLWEFRVRAMDQAGNWGNWKTVKVRP